MYRHDLSCLVVVIVMINCPANALNSYIFLAPKVIRPGMTEAVTFTLLEHNGNNTEINVTLEDSNGNVVSETQDTITTNNPKQLHLQIPQHLQRFAKFRINSKGIKGLTINDSVSVSVTRKNISVFIQTDKGIYKAGQTIRIRSFALYPNGSIYLGYLTMVIEDPKGNIIKKWMDLQEPSFGVVSKTLSMDDKPVLGVWKVNVTAQGFTQTNTFKVQEYVLPKFKLDVNLPSFVLTTEREITGFVKARYTYGKPVPGYFNVTMTMPDLAQNVHTLNDMLYQASVHIKNDTKFSIPLSNLHDVISRGGIVTDQIENLRLKVHITFEEDLTNKNLSKTLFVRLTSHSVRFEILNSGSRRYIPGLEYPIKVRFIGNDGRPPTKQLKPFQLVMTSYYKQPGTYKEYTLQQMNKQVVIPAGGITSLTLHMPTANSSIYRTDINVTHDGVSKNITLIPYSEDQTHVRLRILSSNHQVGENVTIQLQSNQPISYIYYQFVSKGQQVKSGKQLLTGGRKNSFEIELIKEMAPETSIVVYNIDKATEKIYADQTTIEIQLSNKVLVRFGQTQVEPGTNVTLNVQTDPHSMLHILAVDSSSLLMGNDNDITEKKVVNDFKALKPEKANQMYFFKTQCDVGYVTEVDHDQSYSGYRFEEAGVITLTDVVSFDYYSNSQYAIDICKDSIPNCFAYGKSVCGDSKYAEWVYQNCKAFCGVCGTVSPIAIGGTCRDKLQNCTDYGVDICIPPYTEWAKEHCFQYCGFKLVLTGPDCVDKISNCTRYGKSICTNPGFATLAKEKCRAYCRRCTPLYSTGYDGYGGTSGGFHLSTGSAAVFYMPGAGTGIGTGTLTGTGTGLTSGGSGYMTSISNSCVMKGVVYSQGETWTDGCRLKCTCLNAVTGYYQCTELCPKYDNLPSHCSVDDYLGECCGIPKCSGAHGDFQTVDHIRSEFPETWLWTSEYVGDTGSINLSSVVPDTITSWVASAFSINKVSGLGVNQLTSTLNVFRSFFINVNLPFSVIHGEEVVLQVNIYNYMRENLTVLVTLEHNEDFKNILVDDLGYSSYQSATKTQNVQANSGEAVSVYFPIIPSVIGKIDISVKAQSTIAADAVQRQLRVEPEGIPKEYNIPLIIDMSNASIVRHSIRIEFPYSLVKNSERVQILAIGDLMGPSIDGLDRLLTLPTGCGEQTMMGFAPDVYLYKYLQRTGQLTDAFRNKAVDYMERGYQRELNFQHWDGSYSIWGPSDGVGSTWLTAFVLKSFTKAAEYIAIDREILIKAHNWLINRQIYDGSFKEKQDLFQQVSNNQNASFWLNVKGGSNKRATLTAFVTIVLIESKHLSASSKTDQAIQRARTFLEGQINHLRIPYDIAIISYALLLAGSPKAIDVFAVFEQKQGANIQIPWQSSGMSRNHLWNSPNTRATPVDIETSSYVLLYYTTSKQYIKGQKVLKWIVKQRNSYGGFASTQDTVVALEAMSQLVGNVGSQQQQFVYVITKNDSHVFNINQRNRMVLQKFLPSSTPSVVNITATGTGVSLIQVAVDYNVHKQIEKPKFELNVSSVSESLEQISTKMCTRYNGTTGRTVGMAIIEYGIPSGFDADLESVISNVEVRKTEVVERNVVFYLDEITSADSCVTIRVDRSTMVANVKASPVRVYDYYNPESQVTSFYTPFVLRNKGYCDVCTACKCGLYRT